MPTECCFDFGHGQNNESKDNRASRLIIVECVGGTFPSGYVFILYVKFAIVLPVQIRPADCATTSWLCYALLRNVSFLFLGNFIVFTSSYAS